MGYTYEEDARKTNRRNFERKLLLNKGEDFTLVGEYVSMRTRTTFRHDACGFEWITSPYGLLASKRGCPKCSKRIRYTEETIRERLYELVGDEYTMLGTYVNIDTKTKMRHNKCQYEWDVELNSFFGAGNRCPKCAGNLLYDTARYKDKIRSLVGDEYTVLGEYVSNKIKVTTKHELCGYVWDVRPDNFSNGTRCPKCRNNYKGEELVARILSDMGCKFVPQKSYDDLVYKRKLYFDFYVEDANLLIEYDGIQHYEPVTFGGRSIEEAEQALELVKFKDKLKNEYCKDKGISLLRIPYTFSEEEASNTIKEAIKSQEVTQGNSRQKVSS